MQRSDNRMANITIDTRKKVLDKCGYRCFYCKSELMLNDSTVDHKQPKCKNGPNTLNNLVASCPWCNKRKGSKSFETYMKMIGRGNEINRAMVKK